ncbi:MAG: hypothetical protein ACFFAS_07835 [Promethearchaeota archaeon]
MCGVETGLAGSGLERKSTKIKKFEIMHQVDKTRDNKASIELYGGFGT